jgi:LPXTG-motif cell wall-anchored protein
MNSMGFGALGLAVLAGAGFYMFTRRRRRVSRVQRLARDAEEMLKQAEERLTNARKAAAKVSGKMREDMEHRIDALESRRNLLRKTVEDVRLRAMELVGQSDGR